VDESLRQPILSGLDAAERILNLCSQKTVVKAALDLDERLKRAEVNIDDFQNLLRQTERTDQ